MTVPSLAEKSPTGEVVYVPEGWALWRNGSDTTSTYWTAWPPEGQRVSTLPSLDQPTFIVQSPVERTYPGIYFVPNKMPNPYVKDLIIDVLVPRSLGYMGDTPPVTEADSLLQGRATKLFEINQRQLEADDGNLYIPDGEVLCKVVEPHRDDASPRRIVYVPEPFYGEYQRLQAQAGGEAVA